MNLSPTILGQIFRRFCEESAPFFVIEFVKYLCLKGGAITLFLTQNVLPSRQRGGVEIAQKGEGSVFVATKHDAVAH